ncbi:uncharacterized protein BT62DRAFT_114992 [Guyanagaster necrorhizus]|uniref:RPA43 OB domain-containing protein n=1 Tax=Guyanagaster necrorhizus TaxID=856835 RepID=A0A9P7VUZ8_9AGAR|nr:uncharacterized protein BT62DRAFT_114992 [Guyanagaster necrorhizus MCA 3950]KAG7446366.1 hypothetical protein BT62DRAFT_114992 [Guyanagaster necrorhizus MCA 3950]
MIAVDGLGEATKFSADRPRERAKIFLPHSPMSSSTISQKKRKNTSPAPGGLPVKKTKRDNDYANKKTKDKKGKGRESDFHVVQASLVLSIPPKFADNPKSGVNEMLDSMVMRYIPGLQGVVLSHSSLTFLDDMASIKADCPFLVCRVAFDATVWSPHVGMRLEGRINLCSPDHISLLVHRTFNVSVPRHHIPSEDWEFEYGPAENDPQFGPDAVEKDATSPTAEKSAGEGGRWTHKLTGDLIGGKSGHLEFTVIGLTVANEMLSVVGSIQPDPFSLAHVATSSHTQAPEESEGEGEGITLVEDDNASSVDEDDTFAALGREAEKAQKKAKEEKNQKRKLKATTTEPKGKKKQKKSS